MLQQQQRLQLLLRVVVVVVAGDATNGLAVTGRLVLVQVGQPISDHEHFFVAAALAVGRVGGRGQLLGQLQLAVLFFLLEVEQCE